MRMEGSRPIAAPPDLVWAALFDPGVLQRCIPGCEDVERLSATDYAARVVLKLGPVKARFAGRVALTDLEAPARCRIIGEGAGGIAGFAKGQAELVLTPAAEGTLLSYAVDAQIGGKLAQLGARIIDSTAMKLADDFFARFAEILDERVQGAA